MTATVCTSVVDEQMMSRYSSLWIFFCLLLIMTVLTTTPTSADVGPQEPAAAEEASKSQATRNGIQGPATIAPREILDMLEQRKRFLDKREAALRGADTHLLELKAELEQIVTRHEQLVEAEKKRRLAAQTKASTEADKSKAVSKPGGAANVNQTQLAKIYEAMPPEEAAARLERMPERKALEVLRLLKGKSAGSILAEVKPERAARLTEQLLAAP
jgi:flagellar motility protein MotE (MotC chaperone)